MKRQIFVVDVVWTGHIPSFHKMIVKGFLELGNEVFSLCPNPASVQEYIEKQDPDFLKKLTCLSFSEKSVHKTLIHKFFERFAHKGSFLRKQWDLSQSKASWTQAKELIDRNNGGKVPFVFFPYVDYGFQNPDISVSWIEQKFPYEWSVLNITPQRLTGNSKNIYLSKRCKSISILDERFLETLTQELQKPVYLFPEIVHRNQSTVSTKLTNQILKEANGRKLVVLAGIIGPSKKMITFLEMAKLYESKLDTPLFVVAGEFFLSSWSDSEQITIKNLIEHAGDNVFTHFHRIESEEEFNKLYEIADVIYAIYNNFDGSSNTLSKASLFNKPVLVAKGNYLIAKRVNKFNLGLLVDENNAEECVSAINTILNFSEQELNSLGFDDYLLENSEGKLVGVLEKAFY